MKGKKTKRLAALLALLLALSLTGVLAMAEEPGEGDLPEIIVLEGDPSDPGVGDPSDPVEPSDPAGPVDPLPPPALIIPAQAEPAVPQDDPSPDPDPAPVYAVRFLVGEGEDETVFAVHEVEEGAPISAPENKPLAEGLVFAHWYDARGAAETPFLFETAATENLVLRALFVAPPAGEDDPIIETEGEGDPDGEEAPGLIIIVIEDDPIPLAGPAQIPVSEDVPSEPLDTGAWVINFHMYVPGGFTIGDDIVFTSVLDGFEGLVVTLQWQVKTPGGDWRDIDGATGESYTLHTNSENVAYVYRVTATVWP